MTYRASPAASMSFRPDESVLAEGPGIDQTTNGIVADPQQTGSLRDAHMRHAWQYMGRCATNQTRMFPQVRLCSGGPGVPQALAVWGVDLSGSHLDPWVSWGPAGLIRFQEALARKGLLPSCQTKGVHHGARATARCW